MTVCKHCGTEIEDGLEYCPNCGQSIEENFGAFFDADEDLEEEAYNIFDTPEEFDMDSLLAREFNQGIEERKPRTADIPVTAMADMESIPEAELFQTEEVLSEEPDFPDVFSEAGGFGADSMFDNTVPEEAVSMPMPEEPAFTEPEPQDDMAELFGLFGNDSPEPEEVADYESTTVEEVPEAVTEEAAVESLDGLEFPVAEETDFFALDDLFQDMDVEPQEFGAEEPGNVDHGLEELLAAGAAVEETEESSKKGRKKKDKKEKKKKEKKPFFQAVFGNVPVDPSKIKPEPTPEQIEAKKQKDAETKKAKAEEKKLAAEEKKQNAQRVKEDKARQKALAKEEKKAKKLEEAKQILEEMQETRINRVGATIVFLFFAVCAIVLLSGSEIFGYAISIHNAEENFNKAYNNNVKYYTDAYNDIYGLEIKPEDQVLSDKIMTVMFVNKELNSYNSHMIMEDYQTALHSLLLGLYRYGKYYEKAIPLGIDKDMDYVRTQILKELKTTFDISEDEAEVLRSMLETAGAGGMNTVVDANAAREYNLALYEIVEESGLNDDSNN